MHESSLHYNLSRPYPYRWFTPVVVVAGIALAVLFSVLNVGSQGYILDTQYTNDPNATQAASDSAWFLKAPFNWGNSLRPRCEPMMIPVGYEFFTSNLGMRYTVAGVSQIADNTGSRTQQVLSSLSYLNNNLSSCAVDDITLKLTKVDSSKPPSYWWSWGSTSDVSSHCIVATPQGLYNVTLTANFDYDANFAWIITQNYTTHASLWWGSRLLGLRYMGVEQVMSHVVNGDASSNFVTGSMTWHRNGSDPRSLGYFNMDYYFLENDGGIYNQGDDGLTMAERYNNASWPLSAPMTEGLQFAKTMRALVEVDLGVTAAGNMLLDQDLLQYGILAPDDFNRQAGHDLNATEGLDWGRWNGINWPGTVVDINNVTAINETYALFKNVVGPLGTQTATIFGQYACTVPVQKNMGTLLAAVLLADLVFLQAIWKLFNLIVKWTVTRSDERALWCPGCLNRAQYEGISMEPLKGVDERYDRRDSQSSLVAHAAPIESGPSTEFLSKD